MYTLIRITLKNGKPTHNNREVILGTIQTTLLAGKGEGSSVLMHKEHLKYKRNGKNRENSE